MEKITHDSCITTELQNQPSTEEYSFKSNKLKVIQPDWRFQTESDKDLRNER